MSTARPQGQMVGWLIVATMVLAFIAPGALAGLSFAVGFDPGHWMPNALRTPRGMEAAYSCLVLRERTGHFDSLYLVSLYVTFTVLWPLLAAIGLTVGLSTTLRDWREGTRDISRMLPLLLTFTGLGAVSALFTFDMWQAGGLMSFWLCEHSDVMYLFRSLPAAALSLSVGALLNVVTLMALPRVVVVLIAGLKRSWQ